MRIISYRLGGRDGLGLLRGDRVAPFRRISTLADAAAADLSDADAVDASAAFPLSEARVLPASPDARKIFCVGLNYHSHVEETRRELPQYPVLFPKFASSLIGAFDDIVIPPESSQVDYEAELAVVIGRGGRRIAESEAAGHVLGYTVANDITMRDYQYKTHQWMQGKAWDASTPIGPAIVTPDEFDLEGAHIQTAVNGVTVQDSDLSRLIFSVPRLIGTISEFTALEPGDVILTGTPGGVGFRRDPQLFLHPGDRVSVEIDGVGRIDSRLVAEEV